MSIDLVRRFEETLPVIIGEEGFETGLLYAKHENGEVDMARLAIPQEQIFQASLKWIVDLTVDEIVFGVDRFTRPGQGTKYNDVLTVFWWKRGYERDYGFRFGVVNYCPSPKPIIEPIDWNNRFWTGAMRKVVVDTARLAEAGLEDMRRRHGAEKLDKAVSGLEARLRRTYH